MIMYHRTKFGSQGINSSENIVERLIFWPYEPSLWPWSWRKQTIFFRMTLWLMILHHYSKFDNKIFCGSEDIIWTNIHWHFEPRRDLDLERSNPIFPHNTPPHDTSPYQVWLKMVPWFKRYRLDTIRHTDRIIDWQTDGRTGWQADGVTPIYHPLPTPVFIREWGRGREV